MKRLGMVIIAVGLATVCLMLQSLPTSLAKPTSVEEEPFVAVRPTATSRLCTSGSSSTPVESSYPIGSWTEKPVEVNIQVHLESVFDEPGVERILDIMEVHNGNWHTTVFVSPQYSSYRPEVVQTLWQRGHQIAVVGIQEEIPLIHLSSAEQRTALDRAMKTVQAAVGWPNQVVDWKPQDFRWNSDTLRALQGLGIRSMSDLFPCNESFRCECPYASSLGKVTFPYPLQTNFWTIPISELELESESKALDDSLIFDAGASAEDYLAYLLQGYEQQQQTKDPLIVAVHGSVVGLDDARLEALSQFLDEVSQTGGKVVTLDNLLAQSYITNFDVEGPSDSVPVGDQVALTVRYRANLYCPKYRFRAYGRYDGQKWQLIASGCQYVSTGDHTLTLQFNAPKPPAGQSVYTVRVVGQASRGSCANSDPDWPTLDKYEVMEELSIAVLPYCIPLPGRSAGDSEDRLDLVFVPDDDYGDADNIDSWLPVFLGHINTQIDQRLGAKSPVSGTLDSSFNFYYIRNQGSVNDNNCAERGSMPDDLLTECPFADGVVVLHVTEFGDCSTVDQRPNIYSAEGPIGRSFIHESGHGLFGLADEYDGPTHYFQPDPNPNIWASQDACRSYAAGVGWDANDCTKFTDRQGDWWKVGTTRYIMFDGTHFDNGWGVPAERRIEGVLDEYQSSVAQAASELPSPVPASATQLNMTLSQAGFVVNRAVRLGDDPPNQLRGVYAYRARFLDFSGRQLGEFGFGDPRIKYAESGYTGPIYLESADFSLNLPYYYNGRAIQVYNSSGTLVKTIDIATLASGGISGTVVDSDGQAVDSAQVEVIGTDFDTLLTNAGGYYSVTGLRPGGYVINVIPPVSTNLIPAVSTISVTAGGMTTANIVLALGGTVQGRVTRGFTRPIPDTILYMSGYETPRYSTDAGGYYVMRGLIAGGYTLNIDSTKAYRIYVNRGFVGRGTSATLDVTAGRTITVDFVDDIQVYVPTILGMRPMTWHASTGLSGRTVYDVSSMDATCSTLFAATDNGAYRSTDGGRSWSSLFAPTQVSAASARAFDELTSPDASLVPAITVCPANPNVVYLGGWGSGVYRSADGGNSWQRRNTGLSDLWIYDLAVNPGNCNVVYAGTNSGGVFKTADGGGSWAAVNNGLGNREVRALAIAPGDASRLYVGTTTGVYRSYNVASSWQVSGGLPGTTVWALAVPADNADVVYAGLDGQGVYKTSDGGSTWQARYSGPGNVKARTLAIDPKDTQVIYVGRDDGGGVYRSLDGGASWGVFNDGLGTFNVKSLWLDGGSCHTLHAGTTNGAWYYGF